MSQEIPLRRRRLSPAQIVLIAAISVLVSAIAVLAVRASSQLSGTAREFENTGIVTTNMANIQRELLLLEIESERFVHGPSDDPAPVELPRSLLANQLRRAQIRAEDDGELRGALSDIQKTLGRYDVELAGFSAAGTPEEAEASHEALEATLASAEEQVKALYDKEEGQFFSAVSAGISAQRASHRLLLVGGGVLLAVSLGLVVSLGRSVSSDFKRAYHRVQEELSQRERALAELGRKEEEFRTLASVSPALIFRADSEGNCTYVNERWREFSGLSRGAALGRGWAAALHPEDRDRVIAQFLEAAEKSAVWQTEYRFVRPDGSCAWVKGAAAPQKSEDGSVAGYVGTLLDITESKAAEQAIRESEERFRQLLNQAADAIFVTDAQGRFVDVNEAACQSLGYTREELVTMTVQDIADPQVYANAREALAGGATATIETDERRKDGSTVPVEVRIRYIQSRGQRFGLAIARDVSERKESEAALQRANQELEDDRREIKALNRSLEEKVRQRTAELEVSNRELRERNRELTDVRVLAATDALTGLPNHRAFHETIRKITEETEGAGAPLSLLMLDIDGFKRINDSQGHLVGDQVLREIAASLTRHVTRDRAYRYGGDEFAVILPRTGRLEALRVADRIRRSVDRQVRVDGRGVTISLGAAAYPESAGSAEELIYGADAAMYWAKSAGKNRVGDWSKLIRRRDEDATPWYVGDRAVRAPDAVAALVAALTAKDPSTSAHTDRCSWYSAQLARTLGLSEEEISTIRLASLLHDVGKIGVPDEILFKPGPLNEDEWAEMKKHPAAALHVLREVRAITDATPAILHHHEHFDGSGYPDGLKGENIPIASRILLVTDAFDAMTTDRPYRKAMPIEHAIGELTRNKGSQFDPRIVDAFLKIIEGSGVYEPHSHESDGTPSGAQPSLAGGNAG
ncbi:MAG: PAS domain S-box protein [Dehalococcoidia bacterium]